MESENKTTENMSDTMKLSFEYLGHYIKVTEHVTKKIMYHVARYGSEEICAYYDGWEDFCSDWCDGCGYTRTQARKLLHGGIGEFMILPDNLGIIRFGM